MARVITINKPIELNPKGTIHLNPKGLANRKGIFSGKTPTEKLRGIVRRVERSKPFKVASSARTTAVLGGVLGTLLGGPVTGAKSFAAAGFGAGLLKTSPKARRFLKDKVLRPEKAGEGLGDIIENPDKLRPDQVTTKSTKEKIIDTAKKAGVVGGLAAAAVGGTALAKKAIQRSRAATFGAASGLTRGAFPTGQIPSGLERQAPLGAVQPRATEPTGGTIGNRPNVSIVQIQNVLG